MLPHIKLNAQVTEINYEYPVEVKYTDEMGSSQVVTGKKALVTVPFGVLKAGDIKFLPAFSEAGEVGVLKQKAIDNMNPGKYEKIALFWQGMTEDEIFWDVSTLHAMHVQVDGQQGNFTHWNSYYHVNGVPYLESSASEQYVDIIETLSDEDVVAQAVERLRLYYGEDAVPNPTHYFLPRWYKEKFTKTIYAYATPGAVYETRDNLMATLFTELYFAGEATYEPRFGSVHGALISGIDAAERMLNATSNAPSSATSTPTASPISGMSQSHTIFLSMYVSIGVWSFLLVFN